MQKHDKDRMEHLDAWSRELFQQYRSISAKMRKRFLKKPNLPEASSDFGRLGNAVKNEENHRFAAVCFSAMARCDQLMGDSGGESEAWASAGRQFLEAEEILYSARHASYWDSLDAAIHCFLLAIQAQEKQKLNVMAAMYCLEIAHKLKHFQKYHQALRFFQQASDLQTKHLPECRLQTLSEVANLKVTLREYDSALSVYAKMAAEAREIVRARGLKRGPFVLLCERSEVSQLLLLLMLKIPRRSLKSEHVQLIRKYSQDILDPATFPVGVNKERHLLLQSLINGAETRTYDEIEAIRPMIWDLLEPEQQHLYRLLMESHSTKVVPIL